MKLYAVTRPDGTLIGEIRASRKDAARAAVLSDHDLYNKVKLAPYKDLTEKLEPLGYRVIEVEVREASAPTARQEVASDDGCERL